MPDFVKRAWVLTPVSRHVLKRGLSRTADLLQGLAGPSHFAEAGRRLAPVEPPEVAAVSAAFPATSSGAEVL